MINIVLFKWNSTLSFDSVLGILATVTTIFGAYWVAKVQIRQSEKTFLEFVLQDSEHQLIWNIGGKVAVNVHVYRCFLDIITGDASNPKFVKLTLEHSLGTIPAGKEKQIDLLPWSDFYEIFMIEYQNIDGTWYRSFLRPQTGRGDHEILYAPKPIRFFNKKWKLGPKETVRTKMTRQMRKVYDRK